MSWKCEEPECQFENEDGCVVCACCGRARRSRLALTAPSGQAWRTMIDADITRPVYRRLYPGVEHQYVPRNEGEHPYSVLKTSTGEWQLRANPASPIRTVLNAVACESGRGYGLTTGDVIAIASPANTTKTYAPLTVSLQPIG